MKKETEYITETFYEMTDNQEEDESSKDNETKEKKLKALDILINKLILMELSVDELGTNYITINVDNHYELLDLKGSRFKAWLIREARIMFGKAVNSTIIKDTIDAVSAQAEFEGVKSKLDVRVSGDNETIYYDLCNDNWQVIRMDKTGWSIMDNSSKIFKRYKYQGAQVTPEIGGSINDIFKFINIGDEDRLMFLVYVVSCFIPNIAHPIGVFHGEKGSAKTTTFKILKKLIDPSVLETMTFPKNNEELIQALAHHWYCNFDNISSFNTITSDTLCRAVTGEGYIKRALHTNDDDIIYYYKRCIALNGIEVVAKKEDLLDRSILFELYRIPDNKRKEETGIWNEFDIYRPKILGAIFSILSNAIKIYPTIKLDKQYRLADFNKWGCAIAKSMGYSGDLFSEQYKNFIEKQNQEVLQSNPLLAALAILIADKGRWVGSASELLEIVKLIAIRHGLDWKSPEFPKVSTSITKKINKISSNLKSIGIDFTRKRLQTRNIIILSKSDN